MFRLVKTVHEGKVEYQCSSCLRPGEYFLAAPAEPSRTLWLLNIFWWLYGSSICSSVKELSLVADCASLAEINLLPMKPGLSLSRLTLIVWKLSINNDCCFCCASEYGFSSCRSLCIYWTGSSSFISSFIRISWSDSSAFSSNSSFANGASFLGSASWGFVRLLYLFWRKFFFFFFLPRSYGELAGRLAACKVLEEFLRLCFIGCAIL